MIKNIALVTPLKDEITNIDKYIASIEKQTVKIKYLIIVENDSTDGSKEYLEKISSVKNVENFKVINMTFSDKSYDLGFKYSAIVTNGFDYLKTLADYNCLDFIGILDCDCFPEEEYYEKLINFFNTDAKIGIASGLVYTEEGILQMASKDFVRGNCRVWRKACLNETGFPNEPSPDSISVAMAHIKGWKTKTLKTAKAYAREVNTRMPNYKNQGKRIHYRGHSLFYAFLKFANMALLKGKPSIGYDMFSGYTSNLIKGEKRIQDKDVRRYYKFYVTNKLIQKFKG